MYCIFCGSTLIHGAKFCQACGKAVPSSVEDQIETQVVPSVEQAFAAKTVEAADTGLSPNQVVVSQIRPWIRYFARTIDIILWAFPAGLLLGFFAPGLLYAGGENNEYLLGVIIVLMWVFVEPLCHTVFGTTPGKSLLRIKVIYNSPNELTYSHALKRSIKVWWRGMGAGVPLISLFTLISAYNTLKTKGRTSWDADDGFIVSHSVIGTGRGLLAVALVFFYFVLVASIN